MRRALVLVAEVLVLLGVSGGASAAADTRPWGWPLAGPHEVARGFDPPATRFGAGHRGVDLPSVEGAAVRAAAAGRVTYAGLLAGRGVVVVGHGALRTTYEPVRAAVRVGATVALGEVVGRLEAGHAGCPVAACLHWGLRRGEEYLDPVRLVRRGPLRLLPVEPAAGRAQLPAGGAATAGGRSAPAPAGGGPEPAGQPAWSLRAAEAPLGAAAVVALVLGIGLLARPRTGPGPQDPASGGAGGRSTPPPEEPTAPPGTLVDLDAARLRRQVS